MRGTSALVSGEIERARAALAAIAEHRGPIDSLSGPGASAAQCCSTTTREDYLPGRQAARVMELELAGRIALQAGNRDEALALLADAAQKEDAMGFDFGPPVVVEPAHELLGRVLLDLGRHDEAAREFESALRRAPGRAKSLRGLSLAQAQASF